MTKLNDTKCKEIMKLIPLDILMQVYHDCLKTIRFRGLVMAVSDSIQYTIYHINHIIRIGMAVWSDNLVELSISKEFIDNMLFDSKYVIQSFYAETNSKKLMNPLSMNVFNYLKITNCKVSTSKWRYKIRENKLIYYNYVFPIYQLPLPHDIIHLIIEYTPNFIRK